MELNLPPRLLRVVAGCVVTTILLLSSYVLWHYNRTFTPLGLNSQFSGNETLVGRPFVPGWTTEQLEPKFAYVQYATTIDYLCNAVINFGLLRRYGAEYDLVLIYPKEWSESATAEAIAIANIRAQNSEIKLRPFDIISTSKGDATWRHSLTKFHAFALTEWTRVLAFDSDSLVLNSMDHYFYHSPLAPVAVPRAYWLSEKHIDIAKQVLGSHVMLIEPNEARYHKIITEALKSGDFDMEVINYMFSDSAMILPHRRLALLTGEFRSQNHSKYLAPDEEEEWNAMGEVSRSVLVHFSDWPLPKPWMPRSKTQWESTMPPCPHDEPEYDDRPHCADRVMWTGFYEQYDMERRPNVKCCSSEKRLGQTNRIMHDGHYHR